MYFYYIIFTKQKKGGKMELITIISICCLAIILVAGIFAGIVDQLGIHRADLYPGSDATLPQWWPPQKMLLNFSICLNWIMVITASLNLLSLIILTVIGYIKFKYFIIFGGIGIVCLLVGLGIGRCVISAIIRTRGKRHGIKVLPICF